MHKYEAEISWKRQGAEFSDSRYSRAHEWSFDGGVKIMASSSPLSVPVPYSVVEAVDPEEALVASAASCHMLWFLSIAAGRGFVVESYMDKATGIMEKNSAGKIAITRITLRPKIEFSVDRAPSPEELQSNRTRQHWDTRWYSTGSGSDRAPIETSSPRGARSLPLPVLYQCRLFRFRRGSLIISRL